MPYIDLHLHTTRSDGRWLPREVIDQAAQRDLKLVAITDHDVVSGLAEASEAARELGVELISGVELTADWDGRSCHILGYGIDPAHPGLTGALERGEALMAGHVERVLAAIQADGFELEAADLDRYNTRYATGTSLVLGMLEAGVLRGSRNGKKLLALASREPRAYTVAEAIELIHAAGGVAVLAHPARLRRDQRLLPAEELAPLVEAGLDGVEAWHVVHGGAEREHYRGVAEELGQLVTGGSDCHGPRSTGVRIGSQRVPSEVGERLVEAISSRRDRAGVVPRRPPSA